MIVKVFFVIRDLSGLMLPKDVDQSNWVTSTNDAKQFLSSQDARDFLDIYNPVSPIEVEIVKMHLVKRKP